MATLFSGLLQDSETEFLPDYEDVDVRGTSAVGPTVTTTSVEEHGTPAVGPTTVMKSVDEHGTPAVGPAVSATVVDKHGAPAVESIGTTMEVDVCGSPAMEPTVQVTVTPSTSDLDLEVTGGQVRRTVERKQQSLVVTVQAESSRERR